MFRVYDFFRKLVLKSTSEKIVDQVIGFKVDNFLAQAALCFHGFIYSHEKECKDFLLSLHLEKEVVEKILTISWESQKEEKPITNKENL